MEVVLCAKIKSINKIEEGSEYFTQVGLSEFTYYYKRREAEINLLPKYRRSAPRLRKIFYEVGIRVFEQVDVRDDYDDSIKNPLNGFKKGYKIKLTMKGDEKFITELFNAHTLLVNESFWNIELKPGYALVKNLEIEINN